MNETIILFGNSFVMGMRMTSVRGKKRWELHLFKTIHLSGGLGMVSEVDKATTAILCL